MTRKDEQREDPRATQVVSPRPDDAAGGGAIEGGSRHLDSLKASKIMLVDDEPTTIDVLQVFLEGEGYRRIVSTTDSTQAFDLVAREAPDLLLLDLMMPKVGGLEILQALRAGATFEHLPVVILTSSTESDTKLRALELGATDFLGKPVDPSELALRLRNTLAAKAYQDRLAYYDRLTGLPNRQLFMDRLDRALRHARPRSTECALLFVNLDRFKTIDDTLGHRTGDTLLQAVADRLEGCIEPTDLAENPHDRERDRALSRVGGDEFALLLRGQSSGILARRVAKSMLSSLGRPFAVEGRELFVAASIGVSLFPTDADDTESLLMRARVAMSHAKQTGGNDCQFYDRSLDAGSSERLQIENHLRRAIDRKEMHLHYQPKVDLRSGRIVGAEALLRWESEALGSVPPGRFIPIAEGANLMGSLGAWALRAACQQQQAWGVSGLGPPRLSVNVSSKQLRGGEAFLDAVRSALDASGLEPARLMVELTESAIMDAPGEAARLLRELRALGIGISIDDFGTGYASLSYLKRFPVDELKIDRSFVKGIPNDTDGAAIVAAIIAMAHSLGLRAVAEGVETPEQLEFLAERGCDEYQGYLFSAPVPAERWSGLSDPRSSGG